MIHAAATIQPQSLTTWTNTSADKAYAYVERQAFQLNFDFSTRAVPNETPRDRQSDF